MKAADWLAAQAELSGVDSDDSSLSGSVLRARTTIEIELKGCASGSFSFRATTASDVVVTSKAERQGAAAWRAYAAAPEYQSLAADLETCARIEEASADALDRLLAGRGDPQ